MNTWQTVLVFLAAALAALGGGWWGRRRGRAEGAATVTSAAAAKAAELERELDAVQTIASTRVTKRIEEVRAEAQAALADDSEEALEQLVQEARNLRKGLGF